MNTSVIISLVCCMFICFQDIPEKVEHFKIEGEIFDPYFPYVSLIDLSTDTFVWEDSITSSGKFLISVPKGKYVLCISNSWDSYTVFKPIVLTSDVNVGIIENPLSVVLIEDILKGYTFIKENGYIKYTLLNYKKYDMLTVLSIMTHITDFRIKTNTQKMSRIEIDGIELKKNILEIMEYFKNMSAKNVDYIETFFPSTQYPDGFIRILTSN